MNKNKIQKTIYLTPIQVELGEKKAKSIGLKFNDWIKYLITREIEPLSEIYGVENDSLKSSKGLKAKGDEDIFNELRKYSNELESDDEGDYPLPY